VYPNRRLKIYFSDTIRPEIADRCGLHETIPASKRPWLHAKERIPMEVPPTTLPRAWLIVMLLWVVGCLNYLDRMMLTTMHDSLLASIPMGEDGFGMLTSVFLWVYAFLSPAGGWLADRFGRSRLIIASLAVWSAVTWATAYSTTFPQLLATRALMGISEACYIPAALALISDYHRGATRSLATGIHMSGIYAGMALGGVGGWIAQERGWHFCFFIFGSFGVVYSVLLAVMLRDVPRADSTTSAAHRTSPADALSALGRNKAFWTIIAHWGLLGITGWVVVGWLPTYIKEHFHLQQGPAGLSATGFIQTAAFVGVLVGGAIADRWSRTNLRGRLFVPMIALTAAAPALYMSARTDVLFTAILGLIVYGFARGCSDANMMPILCQIAESDHRATGYGVLNFFSCLMGGLAVYLGGWLKQRQVNLSYIFIGAALGMLICGLLLALVRPKRLAQD
jgi:MFS family permease